VHGLTRQGRDFDYLAQYLAASGRRVICPDLAGRGRSDHLIDPNEYRLPQYCADMNTLIARLDVDSVDWVGTSLGGLIGIVLASMSDSAIQNLVLNDIGPYIPASGLARIARYIREMPASFETLEAAELYFRAVLAPYGAVSDEHWRHITRYSVDWDELRDAYVMLCDRKISKSFDSFWLGAFDIWKYWDAIDITMLILHGVNSDLLTLPLTEEMVRRNKRASIQRFAGCGHVPPLFEIDQIKVVVDFLNSRS
jgi:pimeloyl-ACP methyl ester carboxylesterase